MSTVEISIIMAVYNEETYIKDSVKSILNQSFKNFELIIIDDGSIDGTTQIINSFNDSRIRLIKNEENLGLTKSLNRGLKVAEGKYIARMDADDIALPDRLKVQFNYLEKELDVGVLGGQAIQFYDDNFKKVLKHKVTSFKEIKATLFCNNPMIHSTIMIRKSILVENNITYDETMKASQDYEMWIRLSSYTKIVNLSNILILYRLRNNSITHTSKGYLKQRHIYIFEKVLNQIKLELSKDEINEYAEAILGMNRDVKVDFNSLDNILRKIVDNNKERNYASDSYLKQKLGGVWLKQLKNSKISYSNLISYWTYMGLVYSLKYGAINGFNAIYLKFMHRQKLMRNE